MSEVFRGNVVCEDKINTFFCFRGQLLETDLWKQKLQTDGLDLNNANQYVILKRV